MTRYVVGLALLSALAIHLTDRPVQANPGSAPAPVPSGFLWGVATAGHQYEGGDRFSNWAKWVRDGHTADRNPDGVRGYELYEQDMDLARAMGLNTWRMSIEWSRIEPQEGQIDHAEVAHYHAMLAAARRRGLTPMVTLMHFAYPAWLDARGGWENPEAAHAFNRHVAFMAQEFGHEVQWWLTFNEPNMLLQGAYTNGFFPPGKALAFFTADRVARNLMQAHGLAYDTLHALCPGARVSFNMYATQFRLFGIEQGPSPVGPNERWYLDAARGRLDFACFDYYCRTTLTQPRPHEGWEVYPEGFYQTLKRYHAWTGLPVLVAENGLATRDLAPRKDGWTRGAYMVAHVKQLQRAIADGVPVLGYVHWSITDNYEWGSYGPRFGLYSVEGRAGDFRRVPTDGVAAYRGITAAGGVTPALEAAFPGPGAALAAR
jgi:beta-glucosidase